MVSADVQRVLDQLGLQKKRPRNRLSEILGIGTSTAAAGVAGASLLPLLLVMAVKRSPAFAALGRGQQAGALGRVVFGGAFKGGEAGLRAGIGAQPLGALAALMTPTRTEPEQRNTETGRRALANIMLPGFASYNLSKRVGSVLGR